MPAQFAVGHQSQRIRVLEVLGKDEDPGPGRLGPDVQDGPESVVAMGLKDAAKKRMAEALYKKRRIPTAGKSQKRLDRTELQKPHVVSARPAFADRSAARISLRTAQLAASSV